MDQAEALLNLQPLRQLAKQNPQSIPIFFIPTQFSLTDANCFHNISLHLQILASKMLLVVTFSVPWFSHPPSNQTSSQSILKKSLKTDSGLPYEADLQCQLYNFQLHNEQAELLTSPTLYEGLPLPDKSNPQSSSQPAVTERDLSRKIHLVQLQKENLTLELEVLRLPHAPSSASDDHPAQTSKSTSRKKRVIDWPHEFAPGNLSDYDKIENTEFVTGFLATIKPYNNPKKSAMLEYLDVLMTKASSYSWPNVRAFHAHVAKQIESCCQA